MVEGLGEEQTKPPKTLQSPVLWFSALRRWLSNLLVCRQFKRAGDPPDSAWFSSDGLMNVWSKSLTHVPNSSADVPFYRHEWENNTLWEHLADTLEAILRPLVPRHLFHHTWRRGGGAESGAEAQGAWWNFWLPPPHHKDIDLDTDFFSLTNRFREKAF